MRRAFLLGLAGVLVVAGASRAQYVLVNGERNQHAIAAARPSVRLMSMGALGLTIPDENNEISLYDFGGSLAGVAQDKDAWSLESWGMSSRQTDDFIQPLGSRDVPQSVRFRDENAAVDAVYRNPGRRAIGITRGFNLQDSQVRFGDDWRVRGPNTSGYYNELIGPWSFAIGVGKWSDTESIVSSNIFDMYHSSSSWTTTMAIARTVRGWQTGAQLGLDRSTIRGRSEDASGFHMDSYTWARPATHATLTFIRPENNRLAAGLNLTLDRVRGNEEARISWSNRFPSNGSGMNFAARVPTFEEKEDRYGAAARCSYRLGANTRLGAAGELRKRATDVTEDANSNFPGSLNAVNEDQKSYRAGGGIGWELLRSRLRVGLEGSVVQSALTSVAPTSSLDRTSRSLDLRAGAELLLPSRLALRAGALRGALDTDIDGPQSLYKVSGFTAGLGYLPRGGTISLDAAFRVLSQRPDYTGAPDRKSDTQDLAFSARFLF